MQALQNYRVEYSPVNMALDEITAALLGVKDLEQQKIWKAGGRGLTEWQVAPRPDQIPCFDIVYANLDHMWPAVQGYTTRRKVEFSVFFHFYAFDGKTDLQASVEDIIRWTLKSAEYPEQGSLVGFTPGLYWKWDNPQTIPVTFLNVYEKLGVAIEVRRPLYVARADMRIDVSNNIKGQ